VLSYEESESVSYSQALPFEYNNNNIRLLLLYRKEIVGEEHGKVDRDEK
jgi:hypothetical protein